MHWNHRIFKETHKETVPDNPIVSEATEWFTIREVYYNDDNSIQAYSSHAIAPEGESIESLRQTLEWMLKCLDFPVLDQQEIKCVDPNPVEDDWEGEDWDYDI